MNKNLLSNIQRDGGNNKSAGVVAGRQSNHGSFSLPASISHLQSPAFYMAVAWWGLQRQQPFTRDDIAQAFHVTPRRAADVMTYLATAVPAEIIHSEKTVVRVGSGRNVLFMMIHDVREDNVPAPKAAPVIAPRKSRHASPNKAFLDARDLFLGRRPRTVG